MAKEQPEMDEAANAAADELRDLDQDAVREVALWWKRHLSGAGHKRLGRKLLDHLKDEPDAS